MHDDYQVMEGAESKRREAKLRAVIKSKSRRVESFRAQCNLKSIEIVHLKAENERLTSLVETYRTEWRKPQNAGKAKPEGTANA